MEYTVADNKTQLPLTDAQIIEDLEHITEALEEDDRDYTPLLAKRIIAELRRRAEQSEDAHFRQRAQDVIDGTIDFDTPAAAEIANWILTGDHVPIKQAKGETLGDLGRRLYDGLKNSRNGGEQRLASELERWLR